MMARDAGSVDDGPRDAENGKSLERRDADVGV